MKYTVFPETKDRAVARAIVYDTGIARYDSEGSAVGREADLLLSNADGGRLGRVEDVRLLIELDPGEKVQIDLSHLGRRFRRRISGELQVTWGDAQHSPARPPRKAARVVGGWMSPVRLKSWRHEVPASPRMILVKGADAWGERWWDVEIGDAQDSLALLHIMPPRNNINCPITTLPRRVLRALRDQGAEL